MTSDGLGKPENEAREIQAMREAMADQMRVLGQGLQRAEARAARAEAENAALRARLDLADRLANTIHNYDAALEPNPWDVEWQCVDEALAAYRASAGK